MILYDSAFSPFARKVRIVLAIKNLEVECVDGLDHKNLAALSEVNTRLEVPALVDGELLVVNSADIVAYLDHQYPATPVLPPCPQKRVLARKWERIADSLIDPIMVDISYWKWANRDDQMPEGMLEAARCDLVTVYDQLNAALESSDFVCGELSIADIALFPHMVGAASLEVPLSPSKHSNVLAWLSRLRKIPCFAEDLQRTRDFMASVGTSTIELNKIFWRGERIEWVLARGYEDWFFKEIKEGRVIWPPQSL